MKKIISAVIAISTVFSCFGTLGVKAADGPTIYYSTDKSVWNEIPLSDFTGDTEITFASGTKSAKMYSKNHQNAIDIIDQTQFIYMYAEAPIGATCNFYTNIDTKQSLEPWSSLVDGGEWAWNKESSYASYPVRTAKAGSPQEPVAIPLRLGRVNVMIDYVEDGEENVYKLGINGRWTGIANNPTLTNMYNKFRVYTGDAFGYPIMMNGASVGNDNQTYLYTYSKYRKGDSGTNWNENEMWVGSNFSKWLEGSSYVMMPGEGMEVNNSVLNDSEIVLFDLTFGTNYTWTSDDQSAKISGSLYTDKDGYAGEVIMLMANEAGEDSVYAAEEDGWKCVNKGNGPTQSELLSKSRDYNDYDEKYYGLAIQWNNRSKTELRTENPGASNPLTSSHYKNVKELKYAYRKQFKPGDTVSIRNTMNITSSSDGMALIIPIVKFYRPQETLKVENSLVEAMYIDEIGGVAVNTTTILGNYNPSEPLKAIFALYNNDTKLVGCSTETVAATTSDEFIFTCSKEDAKNAQLKVFFQTESGTPIFQSNLSKVLLRSLDD